jgi:citrate lyase subunit beta/citryl-CoA lyase
VFLQSNAALNSKKILIVRINAGDTIHFQADLDAILLPRVDLLNVPKTSTAQDVNQVVAAMETVEARNNVSAPIRMLLNIETPQALRNAHALASAHSRVAGLQLGLGDLFEPLAISRTNTAAIDSAMFLVRMAAGEAGVYVCDSAFANTADKEGFRAEARRARDLGFVGKSCIHPSQVALANEVFRPTEAEIAHALKVVASIDHAAAQGLGAYVIDGKMIDEPFIRRAQAIVAQARLLGLL